MQVSDKEIQRILSQREGLVAEIDSLMDGIDEPTFPTTDAFVRELAHCIAEMPDREDRIAELRAKIEAGAYRPEAAEIVDAMIRRAIADAVR